MKIIYLFILIFVSFFASCEKADFDQEKKEEEEKPAPPKPGEDGKTVFNVSEAIAYRLSNRTKDTVVWVEGYIVGVVEGTSISNANFSNITEKISNLLLADESGETDYTRCLPVELKAGSIMREELNLSENRDAYKRKVMVNATLIDYFRVPGLKGSYNYKWCSDADDPDVDDPQGPENTNPPGIDTTETVILGGRSL